MNIKKLLRVAAVTSALSFVFVTGCSEVGSKNTDTQADNSRAVNLKSVSMKSKDDMKNAMYIRNESISSPDEAKKLLVEGNKRFVSGKVLSKDLSKHKLDDLSKNGQKPFAVIVSCADSRVPPEIIFDQALGDIFVVRDAGNIVDEVELGSIEYGAEHLKAPLIVVLGHENCGAVKAAVEGGEAPGSIKAVVDKIKPSYDKVKALKVSEDEKCKRCEDENIKNSVAEIRKSKIIKQLEEEKKIEVISAKYHINTGEVAFN